jgi:hypothetical protein
LINPLLKRATIYRSWFIYMIEMDHLIVFVCNKNISEGGFKWIFNMMHFVEVLFITETVFLCDNGI